MDIRRKRLKLRAWRRGTRELDLIFGTMVDQWVEIMSEPQITQIEALLAEQDLLVYDWIIGRTPIPPQHQHEMMDELQNFARLCANVQQGRGG